MCADCFTNVPITRRQSLRLGAAGLAALTIPTFPTSDRYRRGQMAPPEVWPRETWAQDRPPLAPTIPEEVRFLLVHHTAGETNHSEQGAIDQMRLAYDFHTGPQKGWPDVAYNFFIDRFGRVFEARSGSLAGPVQADATGGSQGFAQLVCLLGDFTSVMPSDAAMESLVHTLVWLADRYEVDTTPGATVEFESRGSNRWPEGEVVRAATISGHRDMSQTACPGDTFYPFVRDELSGAVHSLRAVPPTTSQFTSPVPVVTTAGTASAPSAPSTTGPATTTKPATTTEPAATTDPSTTRSTSSGSEGSHSPGVVVDAPGRGRSAESKSPVWLIGGTAVLVAALASLVRSRHGSPVETGEIGEAGEAGEAGETEGNGAGA